MIIPLTSDDYTPQADDYTPQADDSTRQFIPPIRCPRPADYPRTIQPDDYTHPMIISLNPKITPFNPMIRPFTR